MRQRNKNSPTLLPFVRIIRKAIPDPVMELNGQLPCWMLRCYVTSQKAVWISTGVLLRDDLDVIVTTPLGCYGIEAGFHRGEQWLGLDVVPWPTYHLQIGDNLATLPNSTKTWPVVRADDDQFISHPQQWKA